jgi:aryl-alcohol dehydrogenase-like predicted oxidoreductase
MKYRLLGNPGLRVSEMALGTMTFGEDRGWGAPREEAQKVYDAFRDAGGNSVDTANPYTNGASETFVGGDLHQRADARTQVRRHGGQDHCLSDGSSK